MEPRKRSRRSMQAPEKVTQDPGFSEALTPVKDGKLHGGPVFRLLAKVARWHGEYIDYQMEAGVWRKLAL